MYMSQLGYGDLKPRNDAETGTVFVIELTPGPLPSAVKHATGRVVLAAENARRTGAVPRELGCLPQPIAATSAYVVFITATSGLARANDARTSASG